MIVATCGHVDHGKTLLVHALTGIETDRLEEEQQRGLTIDLGFAYADIEGHRLGFVDVPGHIRFIDNMLAGVSVIDFGLLVIAADDGPMPQTLEHLAILELLQITRGAVVLTKTDRVDAARIQAVRVEIDNLLATTAFAAGPIFEASSVTGEGVPALARALADAAARVEARPPGGHFRLAVDRAFTIKGAGVVVTGSVFAGTVAEGDELIVAPRDLRVRVRAIHRQNQPASRGRAGDRCSLNIAAPGLSKDMIQRGDWLTTNPSPATRRADAAISVLATEKPLRHWTPVHIHTGANHVTGRVATLESDRIEPGKRGLVQLVLSDPINLCRGDRLILRDQAARSTIGGGTVVEPFSPARGRARPKRLQTLRALQGGSLEDRFAASLAARPEGFDSREFRWAENLTAEEWRELASRVPGLVIAGDVVISPEHFERLGAALLEGLATWHRHNPKAAGANRQQLRTLLPSRPEASVLEILASRLVTAGRLTVNGNSWALPGHAVTLTAHEEALWRRIHPLLAQAPTRPPVVHDIAKQLGRSHADVRKVLTQCARIGYVQRPVSNRFFLPEALAELERLVFQVAGAAPDGMFTVQQYRDAANIGRNLTIELLEYFDRTGLTLRLGDRRKLARSGPDNA